MTGDSDLQIFDQSSPGAAGMLRELHDAILAQSFPPEQYLRPEVVSPDDGPALIACQGDGAVAGGALAEWYPASASLLLAYLAVRPGLRGGGVGGTLMSAVTQRWLDGIAPALLELDDPRHHGPHPGYGDPAARLRFYHRFGVRALAMPYFQPRLAGDLPRGYHMLLGVLPQKGVELPPAMPAQQVSAFLREYFIACEGRDALDDAEVKWLLDALCGPTVELVPLTQIERIPDPEPPTCG